MVSDAVLAGVLDVPGVVWSACVRDAAGHPLAEVRADRVLPCASVGKVLLLAAVARALDDGALDPAEALARTPDDEVADSGLWQHLRTAVLPVADLAVLVASVSDNLATNVLLRRVGLAAAAAVAAEAGAGDVALLDRVRDVRGPADPASLSRGSATGWSRVVHALASDEVLTPAACALVRGWLATGVDTSMVLAGLGLDPLAHGVADRGISVWHKTGADPGVRADVGSVAGPRGRLSYAVLASFPPSTDRREAVLAAMARAGRLLRREVS